MNRLKLPGPVVERSRQLASPLIAAALATIALTAGWHGVDFAGALYRVGLFHRDGLTLWDSQWYSGHWTFSYSVIFPPVAGVLGIELTAVLSTTLAALAFDRLVTEHFGPSARIGSLLFAVGTLVQVVIGQLPFLLGESLALAAFWAARRGRFRLAVPLGVAGVLASPLAGAFLALAAGAWLLASWPSRRPGLVLLVVAPLLVIVATAVAFPGQGVMPYPLVDFVRFLPIVVLVLVLIPRDQRGVRTAVALYLAATVASFAFPTAMGPNITRLGECVGGPLAACLLWPRRRLLAALAIPLGAMQWTPAFASVNPLRHDPSATVDYFTPLLGFLAAHQQPLGRVEIVPLRRHWESAYAAPTMSLARGWQRQLDAADNPIFYGHGALTPDSYRAWLLENGVRYVAVPDALLDYAGQAEAALVTAGVPGLDLTWSNPDWRVFEVAAAAGIVEGAAQATRLEGGQVELNATASGPVLVRVRYSSHWSVAEGQVSISPAAEGWTELDVCHPGVVRLQMRLGPGDQDECTPRPAPAG